MAESRGRSARAVADSPGPTPPPSRVEAPRVALRHSLQRGLSERVAAGLSAVRFGPSHPGLCGFRRRLTPLLPPIEPIVDVLRYSRGRDFHGSGNAARTPRCHSLALVGV